MPLPLFVACGDIFPRPGEVFPLRWRLWQGRKVYSLTAGFFLPLTNEDETCPLCQGLALWESCRRRRLRGSLPEGTLSVTAPPCHLPRRWRLWQGRKVYSLSAGFFLPLTGEDETPPLCQGLSLWESCRRRRLRGFVPATAVQRSETERVRPGSNPLRHFASRNATSPEGGGFGKGVKFTA